MASDPASVVTLTVANLHTLEQVQKWADLAVALGFPNSARVAVSAVDDSIRVTTYLAQLGVPGA